MKQRAQHPVTSSKSVRDTVRKFVEKHPRIAKGLGVLAFGGAALLLSGAANAQEKPNRPVEKPAISGEQTPGAKEKLNLTTDTRGETPAGVSVNSGQAGFDPLEGTTRELEYVRTSDIEKELREARSHRINLDEALWNTASEQPTLLTSAMSGKGYILELNSSDGSIRVFNNHSTPELCSSAPTTGDLQNADFYKVPIWRLAAYTPEEIEEIQKRYAEQVEMGKRLGSKEDQQRSCMSSCEWNNDLFRSMYDDYRRSPMGRSKPSTFKPNCTFKCAHAFYYVAPEPKAQEDFLKAMETGHLVSSEVLLKVTSENVVIIYIDKNENCKSVFVYLTGGSDSLNPFSKSPIGIKREAIITDLDIFVFDDDKKRRMRIDFSPKGIKIRPVRDLFFIE